MWERASAREYQAQKGFPTRKRREALKKRLGNQFSNLGILGI